MSKDMPIDAKRVVQALAKRPNLLEEVTDLLLARRGEPEPVAYHYSSALAAPLSVRKRDHYNVVSLPLPLDAPRGRYRVFATFKSDAHLKLCINDLDAHAPGNNTYMEKVIDTRHIEPLGERHGSLGGWDYRLTLETGIVPDKPKMVTEAKITVTFLGEGSDP